MKYTPDRKSIDIETEFDNSELWGLCTAIDLKQCNPDSIRSISKITEFIDKLCLKIKMTKYGKPQIVNFGKNEKVAGYSMTQLIETSLISGHFVNRTNSAFIDIFSCSKYDPKEAALFCSSYFQAATYHYQFIIRR